MLINYIHFNINDNKFKDVIKNILLSIQYYNRYLSLCLYIVYSIHIYI